MAPATNAACSCRRHRARQTTANRPTTPRSCGRISGIERSRPGSGARPMNAWQSLSEAAFCLADNRRSSGLGRTLRGLSNSIPLRRLRTWRRSGPGRRSWPRPTTTPARSTAGGVRSPSRCFATALWRGNRAPCPPSYPPWKPPRPCKTGIKRQGEQWRRVPESNRCARICNPLRNHSANSPPDRSRCSSPKQFAWQGSVACGGLRRAIRPVHHASTDQEGTDPEKGWWATLESNQAWVSPAELQSAAAPCSTSPTGHRQASGETGG